MTKIVGNICIGMFFKRICISLHGMLVKIFLFRRRAGEKKFSCLEDNIREKFVLDSFKFIRCLLQRTMMALSSVLFYLSRQHFLGSILY